MVAVKRVFYRVCDKCGSDKTCISKKGVAYWYHHEDGIYCNKCQCKYFINPKWRKIAIERKRGKSIKFKGKLLKLKTKPRKGVCLDCGKVGLTNLHHFDKYHQDDPTKDTIELCVSCHTKRHWKSGSYDARVARQRGLL